MNDPWKPVDQANWNCRLAAHLYRRAAFGGTIEQIDRASKEGLQKTLDRLFDLDRADAFENEMAMAGKMTGRGEESYNLASWWLLRFIRTPVPLLEKMTLFWHGHFATGADKVKDAKAMLDQNTLLRQHALQKFAPLVKAISRDVAMLTYLDSTENRKTRPNENYARELMELFCLGTGHYTENDIKQIARCFTGWEIRRKKFRFNRYQHDNGIKEFLGTRGEFGGDDAIEIVIQQPACARFIARKLIRFFVFDEAPIPDELTEPLAAQLRKSDFNIASVLRTIFSSEFFYSRQSIGKKIKSPVELAIGTCRFLNCTANTQTLARRLAELGQLPLYPPNVKGWDGGRAWINASTVLARVNLVNELIAANKFQNGNLQDWVERHQAAGVGKSTEWIETYLFAGELPKQLRQVPAAMGSIEDARNVLAAIAAMPEHQLN